VEFHGIHNLETTKINTNLILDWYHSQISQPHTNWMI